MNYQYLMQHISYHLHTYVRQYTLKKESLNSFCARVNFTDPVISQKSIEDLILQLPSNHMPFLTAVNELVYAAVATPGHLFVIGPVRITPPVHFLHRIPDISIDPVWTETVHSCEIDSLMTDILLIHNLTNTSAIGNYDVLKFNCIDDAVQKDVMENFSNILFENQELGEKHNPYDQEIREFSSIENGDLEQLEKSWAEDYSGNLGILAKDALRHMKNISIVIITLASRAAMRGGLAPEIAYTLSDSYIQKIEEASDMVTLTHLSRSCESHYARMVRDIKEKQAGIPQKDPNLKITRCKDYIYSHLHDKISVQDLADKLEMNADYLSALFHKCEGITLSDFILNEKINLAKNMLVYSEYSYIEIASYLGFSSQSHMGRHFKKITGITPGKYRETYGVKEFI